MKTSQLIQLISVGCCLTLLACGGPTEFDPPDLQGSSGKADGLEGQESFRSWENLPLAADIIRELTAHTLEIFGYEPLTFGVDEERFSAERLSEEGDVDLSEESHPSYSIWDRWFPQNVDWEDGQGRRHRVELTVSWFMDYSFTVCPYQVKLQPSKNHVSREVLSLHRHRDSFQFLTDYCYFMKVDEEGRMSVNWLKDNLTRNRDPWRRWNDAPEYVGQLLSLTVLGNSLAVGGPFRLTEVQEWMLVFTDSQGHPREIPMIYIDEIRSGLQVVFQR